MTKIDAPLPQRTRARKTEGSRRLQEYNEKRGVKHIPWYVPLELHKALKELALYNGVPLQTMVTFACEQHYGNLEAPSLPPLTAPTLQSVEPHKNFTWYAPLSLVMNIGKIALEVEASRQQLITSAVVNQYKTTEPIARLGITTGAPPYVRAPQNLPVELQPVTRAGQVRRKTG